MKLEEYFFYEYNYGFQENKELFNYFEKFCNLPFLPKVVFIVVMGSLIAGLIVSIIKTKKYQKLGNLFIYLFLLCSTAGAFLDSGFGFLLTAIVSVLVFMATQYLSKIKTNKDYVERIVDNQLEDWSRLIRDNRTLTDEEQTHKMMEAMLEGDIKKADKYTKNCENKNNKDIILDFDRISRLLCIKETKRKIYDIYGFITSIMQPNKIERIQYCLTEGFLEKIAEFFKYNNKLNNININFLYLCNNPISKDLMILNCWHCFKQSVLNHCTFQKLAIIGFDFSEAKINFTSFNEVILSKANVELYNKGLFRNYNLNNTNFIKTKMLNVNFTSCQLYEVDFSKSNLTSCKFDKTKLQNCNFTNSILQDVDFSNCEGLETCDFNNVFYREYNKEYKVIGCKFPDYFKNTEQYKKMNKIIKLRYCFNICSSELVIQDGNDRKVYNYLNENYYKKVDEMNDELSNLSKQISELNKKYEILAKESKKLIEQYEETKNNEFLEKLREMKKILEEQQLKDTARKEKKDNVMKFIIEEVNKIEKEIMECTKPFCSKFLQIEEHELYLNMEQKKQFHPDCSIIIHEKLKEKHPEFYK